MTLKARLHTAVNMDYATTGVGSLKPLDDVIERLWTNARDLLRNGLAEIERLETEITLGEEYRDVLRQERDEARAALARVREQAKNESHDQQY